jgi:hypothetical protein
MSREEIQQEIKHLENQINILLFEDDDEADKLFFKIERLKKQLSKDDK